MVLRYLPILCTILMFSLFYYTYYTIFSETTPTRLNLSCFCAFHIFYFFACLSFVQCAFTSPGTVPNNFILNEIPEYLKEKAPDNIAPKFYLLGRTGYCKKCTKDRPHRSHHCSICQKCILRYDHHCKFLNNCIGLKNHKIFILFLLYSAIACTVVCFHTLQILSWNMYGKVVFMAIFSGFIAIFMGAFGILHLFRVIKNCTGIEAKWKVEGMFDRGKYENFAEIFGKTWLLWGVPVDTSTCEGVKFPIKLRLEGTAELFITNKYLH